MELLSICLIGATGLSVTIIIFLIIHICTTHETVLKDGKGQDEEGDLLIEESVTTVTEEHDNDNEEQNNRTSNIIFKHHFQTFLPHQQTEGGYKSPPIQCVTIKQQQLPKIEIVDTTGNFIFADLDSDEMTEASTDNFRSVDVCRLNFSVGYSKSDSSVVLTLVELSGVIRKLSAVNDYVRMSMTLLPVKERKTMELHFLRADGGTVFSEETFKFNVTSRETLTSSSFRFRLYDKISDVLEVCVGEMCFQLCEIVDGIDDGEVSMWKDFEKTKLKLRYLER